MVFLYLILAIVLLVYLYLTWNFEYWSKRGVPYVKPKILFGSLPSMITRKEQLTSDFDRIYAKYKGKVPFVGVFQIRSPRLFVMEPTLVKDILVRNFKNFHDSEFGDVLDKEANPLFARNPFMLKGEEWKEKRAEVTPAFTNNRLKALYPLIQEVQDRLTKYIDNTISKNEPFDARELCAKYTTDVVALSIFGVDAQSFTKEKPEIREMGRKLLAFDTFFIVKMLVVAAFPWIKKIFSMRFTEVELDNFFINLMEQALKYRKDNKVQREDFLEYLIQLRDKKGIKNIDMAAHTISFFTDGFETSSVAIAHVLYELGKNKQVQDKLRDEINQNCDKNGKIEFDKLNDMPYLDQVFNEGMRMHSPATLTSRICTEPIDLTFEGRTASIEKGINVYIPIIQLHYDPEYYSEPERFMPERFDPENGGVKVFKDKGVFLAFGDGPRMCLGMRFAYLQSKVAIASIVRSFEISVNKKTAEKLEYDPNEFLNVKKGGLWLDFKKIAQ